MKENGAIPYGREMEQKGTQTEIITLGTFGRENTMAQGNTSGRMDHLIQVSSKMERSIGKVNGLLKIRFKVNHQVRLRGGLPSMWASLKMITNVALEP